MPPVDWVYGPDGTPIERLGNAKADTRWLSHDTQHSITLATDNNTNVTTTNTYTPWGAVRAHIGETINLGYNTQYTDPETGLLYLRARYYDPATAQFLTRDPLVAMTREPYAYAGNDPINNTDPTGLGAFDFVGDFFDGFACKVAGFADTVGTWSGYGGLALAGSAFFFSTLAGWAIGLTLLSTGASATQWISGSVAGDQRHQTEGLVGTVTGLLGTSTWGALDDVAISGGMSDLAVNGFGAWASGSRVAIDEAINHADIDSSGCGC